ncbi:MAG TPA: copper homeostasis protein CutC [Candidatus Acidoferrum sp.]|nr:copper homeostasis protein CutC [Candidatus Acidoferrum sp.]
MSQKIAVEISVDSVDSAIAAERGGAARVELCCDLAQGGVTPSAGLIATARKAISIGLHVMIRPRGGDFCYSAQEFEIMKRDILMAKQLRVDGIVAGILVADGDIDVVRIRELVELARPLGLRFHRAFDMTPDLSKSLADAVRSGAARILTSGGESLAENALETIRGLVNAAQNRIAIMACGGIREHNARHIVAETGVAEIHVGQARVAARIPSPMRYRNEKISIGSVPENEYRRFVVSEERVRELIRSVMTYVQ